MSRRSTRRFEHFAQLALTIGLLVGCWMVLAPFIVTILFAMIIALSTGPVYTWLVARLRGRRSLAAVLMCCGFVLAVVVPVLVVASSAAEGLQWITGLIRSRLEGGPVQPPRWVRDVPLLGESVFAYLSTLMASREEMIGLGRQLLEPARGFGLKVIGALGVGVVQVLLAIFVLFFLYRDGPAVRGMIEGVVERLYGEVGRDLMLTAQKTVFAVMLGMVGTAVAQALVAALGFAIAGVPAPLLLASLVFLLSMLPVGPPLVWGGAAFWLYDRGEFGWSLFMVLYGLFAISSVDNVVKPLLIARTSSLPLLIAVLGVFGGVLAFGLVGLFIGPTLLALGISLTRRWLDLRTELPAAAPPLG
ncbi:AI-2E family transporter [Niveibacterium umoris]|uniref:Putative PurR-regulated permease PerM n=1 Tax=Niveibacterium umoris TaxID=1193620 RepID=A0A840BTK7_9RHOO|nr:AI-2E family transporter [Niveibacterium umoris]MBB4014146.1 putative PurR-regulated permease PerM [Niveibacterium umoris]